MKELIFKFFSCVLFYSVFVSCVLQPMQPNSLFLDSQDDCGFSVSQYTGEGVRWERSKFPISFILHESVAREAKRNFISAIEHWNLAWQWFLEDKNVEPFRLFDIDTENFYQATVNADGYNALFLVDQQFARYAGGVNAQGVTHARNVGQTIVETDIVINTETFSYHYDSNYDDEIALAQNRFNEFRNLASSKVPNLWSQVIFNLTSILQFFLKTFKKSKPSREIAQNTYTIPRTKVDFSSLVVHELGHAAGLGHYQSKSMAYFKQKSKNYSRLPASSSRRDSARLSYVSNMEPVLRKGRIRRTITERDLESLFCGYFNY